MAGKPGAPAQPARLRIYVARHRDWVGHRPLRLRHPGFMLTSPNRRVARVAWGVLGYTVLVVLWGAFVRASGAGAGCGDHWPLCNGEVVPTAPALNTMIEFGHRITSALAGFAALGLLAVVWRGTSACTARRAAVASLVFVMVLEGALGAGLVLFEYVAYNPSIARAYWMAAHLTNTFLLMVRPTLTAWWAEATPLPAWSPRRGGWWRRPWRRRYSGRRRSGHGAGSTPFISSAAASTRRQTRWWVAFGHRVLGPDDGVRDAGRPGGWMYATRAPARLARSRPSWRAFIAQMAIGALNVVSGLPIWMQILHLFVTDLDLDRPGRVGVADASAPSHLALVSCACTPSRDGKRIRRASEALLSPRTRPCGCSLLGLSPLPHPGFPYALFSPLTPRWTATGLHVAVSAQTPRVDASDKDVDARVYSLYSPSRAADTAFTQFMSAGAIFFEGFES